MKKLLTIILIAGLFTACSAPKPMQRKYVIGVGFITPWQPFTPKYGDTIVFVKDVKFKDL